MTLFTKNPLERLMMQRPYPGKEETPRTPAPEGHFCCGCSRYGTVCLRPCYRDTDLREKLRAKAPIVCGSGPFKAPLPVSLGSLGKGFALGVGWVPCSIQKAALFIAFHRAGQPVQQRLRREANLSGVPIFTPVIPCEEGTAVPGRHHLHAGIFCKVLPECLQHPFKAQHPYHILFRCILSFMGTL